jgi:hypothetical protein
MPSVDLKNSHSSRDFPVPAWPVTRLAAPGRARRCPWRTRQPAQLAIATDERGLQPDAAARATDPGDDAQRGERAHGLLTALDLMGAGVLVEDRRPLRDVVGARSPARRSTATATQC